MTDTITVLAAPTPVRLGDVTTLLRTLVESADGRRRVSRGAPPGTQPDRADAERTWAVLGDMLMDDVLVPHPVVDTPVVDTAKAVGSADSPGSARSAMSENERVVEHDRVGRLAVRLAVDKVLCVGSSRSVRALHQGAVMEGSWGDEARLTESVPAALDLLGDDVDWIPNPGDTVLLAVPGLRADALATLWRDRFGHDVTVLGEVTT